MTNMADRIMMSQKKIFMLFFKKSKYKLKRGEFSKYYWNYTIKTFFLNDYANMKKKTLVQNTNM